MADDARPGLLERVGPAIHLSLGELWESWLAFQRGWLRIERDPAASSKPPQETLLAAVLSEGG